MQPKQMEDKTGKDQLQAVWFAAGMAVVIACLERAAVVSIFKHWHVWVFLALNLLLIAILFTSTHPPQNSSSPSPKSHSGQESDKTQPPTVVEDLEDVVEDGGSELNVINQEREESRVEDEEADDEKSSNLLSNEELNERVEAFIARFRQQYLVSDVRISRSRSENMCGGGVFSKTITV